jgi:hypothetical protein
MQNLGPVEMCLLLLMPRPLMRGVTFDELIDRQKGSFVRPGLPAVSCICTRAWQTCRVMFYNV